MQLDLPTPDAIDRPAPTRIVGSAPGCTLKRPRETDDHVVRAAAEIVAVKCAQWDPTSKAADWVDDLVKARHHWDDGYRLARHLDDHAGVVPDGALVEVLDDAAFTLSEEHRRETRRWVGIVGFEPRHTVGDRVACRKGPGIVNDVLVETAQYVVATDGRAKGGYVLDAEEVSDPT